MLKLIFPILLISLSLMTSCVKVRNGSFVSIEGNLTLIDTDVNDIRVAIRMSYTPSDSDGNLLKPKEGRRTRFVKIKKIDDVNEHGAIRFQALVPIIDYSYNVEELDFDSASIEFKVDNGQESHIVDGIVKISNFITDDLENIRPSKTPDVPTSRFSERPLKFAGLLTIEDKTIQ